MSYRSNVDEQVVKMSFDNSNFDSNVNDSIKTLNKLDEKLSLLNKEDYNGFKEGINGLTNFFTLKGQVTFGILNRLGNEVVNFGIKIKNVFFKGIKDGIGEYNTIIDSTQTIYQNVKQSGATLQNVNDALDELNDYADKTIYNFGQMTTMIGRFTSAGVGLSKSVSTIKGLANAAALVGANTEKAQMAWNAVSKAMSKGSFDLLTWKTLEYSNIAGEQFKNVITEAARANKVTGKSGQNIDQMLAKYGDLGHTLQEGWLTRDLFNEAMQILSGALSDEELKAKGYTTSQIEKLRSIADAAEEAATKVRTFKQLIDTLGEAIGSGWAQSFRILVGDLEQAKDLYTRISDVISKFIDNNAKIRNKLFKQIMDDEEGEIKNSLTSGRENFRKTIENMMAVVKTFLKAVKTGFLNIFPIDRISEAARKVMNTIQNFTRALVINNEELNSENKVIGWDTDNIERVSEAVKDLIRFFRGLASAIDIVWMAISQPIKAVLERIPIFQNFFSNTNKGIVGLLKNLGKFGDKITVVRNAIKDTNFFNEIVGYFIDNIEELGKKYPVLGAILWIFKSIKLVFEGIRDTFKKFNIKPLATLFGAIKFIAESVWRILNFVFQLIRDFKNNTDWSWLEGPKNAIITFFKKLSDYGQGLITFEELIGEAGEKIKRILSSIFAIFRKSGKESDEVVDSAGKVQKAIDETGKGVGSVWNKIRHFFLSIKDFFENIGNKISDVLDEIPKKIALIGAGIAVSAIAVSKIIKTIEKIKILDNINDLLAAGVNVLKAYEKQLQSKTILNIAISIGILAGAMLTLSLIPYNKLEDGLVIFTSFMAVLAVTLPPIISAVAKIGDAFGYANQSITKFTVMNTLAKKFGSAAKTLARGLEIKMIGSAFKDFAMAILILVGAMTALVFLFKNEEFNLIKSVKLIAIVIGVMTASIAGLIVVMELLSKKSESTKASVQTFASFFKLAGISRVILSIAAAVLMLAGAMAIMTKLDPKRLKESWGYIMFIIAALGVIAISIAGLTALSNDASKLTKVSVSITGALLGFAAVLLAIKTILPLLEDDKVKNFRKLLGKFGLVIIALLGVAKLLGTSSFVWENLNRTMLVMTASLLGLASVLYVISLMGDVPESVIAIVGILSAAMVAIIGLMSLMTLIAAKTKTDFSTGFGDVIIKIAIAISAVVASISVMIASIAAMLAVLSSMNIDGASIGGAVDGVFDRLEKIADSINRALPKLKKAFYSIGCSAGSMFMSFFEGFTDTVISSGEKLNSIVDKFANLIIDVLSRLIDVLHTRKDDIAQLVRKILDLVIAIITATLNSFFHNKRGKGLFSEDFVARFLGIAGLTYGGFKIFTKITDGIKTVKKSLDAIGVTFKNLKKGGEKVVEIFGKLKSKLGSTSKKASNVSEALLALPARASTANASGQMPAYLMQTGELPSNYIPEEATKSQFKVANSLKSVVGAMAAVAGAVVAVEAAFHGLAQTFGKEAAYIRSDLTSEGEVLTGMLTDTKLAWQVIIEGVTKISEIIVTAVWTGIKFLITPLLKIAQFFVKQGNKWVDAYYRAQGIEGMGDALNMDDFFEKWTLDSADEDWYRTFHDEIYNSYEKVIDGAAERAYNDGYDIYSNIPKGGAAGVNDNIVVLNNALSNTTKQGVDIVKKILDEHSPSKVFEKIYKDVMYGSVNGVENNKDVLYRHFKHVTQTLVGMAEDDTEAINTAWNDILNTLPALENYENASYELGKAFNSVYTDLSIDDKLDYYKKQAELYAADSNTPARRLKFGEEEGLSHQIELNEKLLNLAIDRAETYDGIAEGIDRATLHENLMKIATEEVGMAEQEASTAVVELMGVLSVATDKQSKDSKFLIEDFNKLSEFTSANIIELIGKQRAASEIALTDVATNYANMGQIAEDHKEELIGLKQEEVQEKLKAEAVAAGMSEQAAEDSSRMITATLFAGASDRTSITEAEFNYRIKLYKGDLTAYEKYQAQKTFIEQEAARLRAAIEANAAHAVYDEAEKMAAAGADVTSIVANIKNSTTAADRELHSYLQSSLNTALSDLDKLEAEAWDGLYSSAERAGVEDAEAWAQGYIDQAMNIIGKQQTNKKGGIVDILSNLWSSFGLSAPDVDLKWWDFDDAKKSATLTDTDVASAVSAASDLKNGLESQRADLTPTFDLDKLASDAQKANGIVMSSLMAAQNASIGDYINQDSELNPFMKDRWQNVYNFTQNNYSPKALSRIDIYRQTQRQLGMSRGF